MEFLKPNGAIILALGASAFLAIGCKSISELNASTEGGTTTTTTSSSSTSEFSNSCTEQIIDYGAKGLAAGTQRGQYSDVAVIPGTTYPATAYTDKGGAAGGNNLVRFTYWNGNQFVVENIGGQVIGRSVRLAFLTLGDNAGRPIVIWSEGNATTFWGYLRIAIRDAALTSSSLGTSTWTVRTLDSVSGGATATGDYTGLSISVSPSDQVAIGYIFATGSATNNKSPRFAYCNSSCGSVSSYAAMTSAVAAETPATTWPQVQTDVGWCGAGGGVYYPVMAYAQTGAIGRVAVCRNSTLSNCATPANWTAGSMVTATGGTPAFNGFSIHVNPSTTGDTIKVLTSNDATTNMSGLRASVQGAGCDVGALTFVTNTQVAAPPIGVTGMTKLLKDASGSWHAIVNVGTTAMRYYNSQTTTVTGAWNTVGTPETVTLSAGATSAFGGAAIAYDASTGLKSIYFTYPTGNAAAISSPYDLRLGIVGDYSIASSSANAYFDHVAPDSTGGILPFGAGTYIRSVSVDSTSTSRPAVAYVDHSSAGTIAGGRLWYAIRGSTTASSEWQRALVGNTRQPTAPKLLIDQVNDYAYIGYYDQVALRFYMARNDSIEGSGTWETYEFPERTVTANGALPASNEACITMYKSGGVRYPVFISLASGTSALRIRSAQFDLRSARFSALSTTGISLPQGGAHLSCASSSDESTISISYMALTTGAIGVYNSVSSDGGTTWSTPVLISPLNAGAGARMTVHPTTGYMAISWIDPTSNLLAMATCNAAMASCSTSTNWSVPTNMSTSLAISSLITNQSSTSAQLLSVPIVYSGAGTVNLFYTSGPAGDGALKRIVGTGASATTSTFSSGANGNLAGLSGVAGANALATFGVPWMPEAVRAPNGNLFSAYVAAGNWLGFKSCGD